MDVYSQILSGVENEYAIVPRPGEDLETLLKDILRLATKDYLNTYGRNGSRLYLDVGSHLEYATPECLEGQPALSSAVMDRVGERQIIEYIEKHQAAEGLPGVITLLKNNTDGENFWGTHENYSLRRDPEILPLIIAHMKAFFVTRQIIDGSGHVSEEASSWEYQISQRSDAIQEEISSKTTESRPLINLRDEPHATADIWYRYHHIAGGANILFRPGDFKVRITALLLRMLELRRLKGVGLCYPVNATHQISRDVHVPVAAFRKSQRITTSAVDIQRHYWRQANAFEKQFPNPAYRAAIDWWGRVLNRISERDYVGLVGDVDWATKRFFIDAREARLGRPMTFSEAKAMDLGYHTLCGVNALAPVIRKRFDPALTSLAVGAAQHAIPHTRARVRGEVIGRLIKYAEQAAFVMVSRRLLAPVKVTLQSANWNMLKVEIGDDTFRINLGDPFKTTSGSAKATIKRLDDTAH